MTRSLQEIYALLDGSYETMISRLRKDTMIEYFMQEFIEDEEFSRLEKAMRDRDESGAFEAAHSLKGVALNMEFGFLSKSLIALTDSLRQGFQDDTDALYQIVKQDYLKTVEIIKREDSHA